MIELVDTHCHIQTADADWPVEDFTRDKWLKAGKTSPDPMVVSATASGVTRLICVGNTLQDSKKAVEYVKTRPNMWASIGLHPHEASKYVGNTAALDEFSALLTDAEAALKIVAIGECGLDYYYEHSSKADQATLLRFQLKLAQEYDLPVIFHVRDAFDDFWPIFDEFSQIKRITGVIHSFSATESVLKEILKRGLYVGLNGIMTFTKDERQLTAARAVPLDKLVLETDAPFLTPAPNRGSICEPSHMAVTANFLSSIRGDTLEELAAATTMNAVKLFNLG
jgi:TatD DNase family protein